MKVTVRMAEQLLEVLDEERKKIREEEKAKYPFAEWERKREKVKERLRKLPEYVKKAVGMLQIDEALGRPKSLDLVQRAMLFLFTRMMGKSNRDVEEVLELFEPLFGFKVSYKYVERLYSDEEVKLVLHNLFMLLLQDEGVSGDLAGDGTGYSFTVEKHYRSDPKKHGKDYNYTFRLIDINTGMYVGFGYSRKSEMDAFKKAMSMIEKTGINIDTISLDKYYASRKVLKLFDKKVAVYVIPKKNISNIGFEWARIIKKALENPYTFLKTYFMRNLSEAGHSADKRRFGRQIRQKKEDRQEMAMATTALLHNIFTTRITTN